MQWIQDSDEISKCQNAYIFIFLFYIMYKGTCGNGNIFTCISLNLIKQFKLIFNIWEPYEN